ncbi:MAG: RluA family pseudouridine synthase [Cyanobacteriota bacterium]|jgi:23S rRNA pseudouridine1911/1915/1917 synthase
MTGAETLTLTVLQGGERLDRWLSAQLPQFSRSRLQKLIEGHQVWVNDQPVASKHYKLQSGDRLCLEIPAPEPLDLLPQAIPLEILYEDDQLLILNKPVGLVVHPAPGHADGTLVNALLAHCPDLAGIGGVRRPGIVHRLDKDTSGAMAVAKTETALQSLQAQLKTKTARRLYWGIVQGSPKSDSGVINLPIGRHPKDRLKMGIVSPEKGGREAVTHWRVRKTFGDYSWLEFQLQTGRTHQIRVHAKELGHPLAGDLLYGAGKSPVKLPGQALHAYQLTLCHPLTQQEIQATAPPPASFTKLLTYLQNRR